MSNTNTATTSTVRLNGVDIAADTRFTSPSGRHSYTAQELRDAEYQPTKDPAELAALRARLMPQWQKDLHARRAKRQEAHRASLAADWLYEEGR
jgi:hypothetical protein